MGRWQIAERIRALDPDNDAEAIMHFLAGWEFAWDWTRSLEVALYRTFCVPSISELLARTGEFEHRPQRRYDDTALLIAEIMEHGYSTPRGQEAIRRVNAIHSRFAIGNDDYLYVLSTFHLEPIRWVQAFGWRRLTDREVQASFVFWREVGRRMGIEAIPADHLAFEAWSQAFEARHFRSTEDVRRVGTWTRDLFLSWFPGPTRPFVRQAVYAMLDDVLLDAFQFPRPPGWLRGAVRASLRLRGRILRVFPGGSRNNFITHSPQPSWPKGYRIADLGPPGQPAIGEDPKD